MRNPNHLHVGKIFPDKEAFKLHMSLYAITNKFRFLTKKSEPGKMLLACSGVSCSWRVYAAKVVDSPCFQIRTINAAHTCTVNERWAFRDHATSNVVGGLVRHRYGTGEAGGPTPGVVRDIMMNDHSVPISYWKAWKSREFAMEQGTGNADASYLGLPAYLTQLATANPGTIVSLETTPTPDGAQRFKYLFLSYGASVQGYQFMKNVVIIDGTHLKGKFRGCLLTASAQDGNNHIFPIGFGIVDSENDEAWTWFFTNLLSVVPDSEDLVFVSDRHNSIYSGIRKVWLRLGILNKHW